MEKICASWMGETCNSLNQKEWNSRLLLLDQTLATLTVKESNRNWQINLNQKKVSHLAVIRCNLQIHCNG
jgi:hypothetical protein